jgi:hypothetical protein
LHASPDRSSGFDETFFCSDENVLKQKPISVTAGYIVSARGICAMQNLQGLGRGFAVAIVALTALTSVSAVVHAKKQPHIVLRPTAALPAVNVP